MLRRVKRVSAMVFWVCLIPGSAWADWPQFRGPNGNGYIGNAFHPVEWSSDENVAWSQAIPGGGWSSPIVVGEKIFLTAAVDPDNTKPMGFAGGVRNMRGQTPKDPLEFKLLCLNLKDGAKLWEKTLAKQMPKFPIHPSNTYATESPTSDGDSVFCYFAAIGLVAAVDLDGKAKWSVDIGAFPSGNGFGTGSSLAYEAGHLFVQCDNDESSFVVALDATNGQETWKRDRSSRTCWSTPFVWKQGDRTVLVVCGSGNVIGYDPQDGSIVWELTNIDSSFTASPASDANHIFIGNSGPMSQGPLIAVGSDIHGETRLNKREPTAGIAWSKMRAGPGMASPVVSGDYLYVCSRGILACYNVGTGEQVYKARLPGAKSIAASSWADDKHVFLLDENGKTFVIQAGPEFKIVGENQVDDLFWSTPAVADGALLLRGVDKLYCIRK